MEVDNAQHLVVRDISLQGTRLALPGAAEDSMPAEIKQQLETLKTTGANSIPASASSNIACLFTATG